MRGKGSGTAVNNQLLHGAVQGMSPFCLQPLISRGGSGASNIIGDGNETRGGGGGDANKSELFLLSFSRYELYRHMIHVNSKRAEAMKGVL